MNHPIWSVESNIERTLWFLVRYLMPCFYVFIKLSATIVIKIWRYRYQRHGMGLLYRQLIDITIDIDEEHLESHKIAEYVCKFGNFCQWLNTQRFQCQ